MDVHGWMRHHGSVLMHHGCCLLMLVRAKLDDSVSLVTNLQLHLIYTESWCALKASLRFFIYKAPPTVADIFTNNHRNNYEACKLTSKHYKMLPGMPLKEGWGLSLWLFSPGKQVAQPGCIEHLRKHCAFIVPWGLCHFGPKSWQDD